MFPVQLSRVPAPSPSIALAAAAAGCCFRRHRGASPPSKTGQPLPHAESAYTAAQLRSALLTSVNGARPAVPAEAGAYGSLPGVKATRESTYGVKITPAKCAHRLGDRAVLAEVQPGPGHGRTFRFGTVGASEVLLAPPAAC